MCNSREPLLYLDGDDNALDLKSVGSSRTLLSHGRILRCPSCGLHYRSFRPENEELSRLYRAADDSRYEAEMPNRWRTAHRHKRIIDRYVSGKGDLLDVGCASGAFLRLMRDAGWNVEGIEPSESQFRRAVNLLGDSTIIRQCMLQGASLSKDYDLITLWDVLEHVTEPAAFLQLASSHLKSGGHLVLNVPQADSFIARLLGYRWPLLLAEHLNYFTRQSLRICGASAGLRLMQTGHRPSSFSLDYILFRATQHEIPGAVLSSKALRSAKISHWSVPVWLGEIYAVFKTED
ncbi:MAG: class I SAM-dependent methyltransferase [Acidobacteriaceae bacterium]